MDAATAGDGETRTRTGPDAVLDQQRHVRRRERCVGSAMSFGAAQSLRI